MLDEKDFFIDSENRKKGNQILGLTKLWPDWLEKPEGGQTARVSKFKQLLQKYNSKPRKFRNRLVHDSPGSVNLSEVQQCLHRHELIANINQAFGQNFLALHKVNALLADFDVINLPEDMCGLFNRLVDNIIEG